MNDRYMSGLQKRTSCWRCGTAGHTAGMHWVATDENWVHICKTGIHPRLVENSKLKEPDPLLPLPSKDGMYSRDLRIEGSNPRQGPYRSRGRGNGAPRGRYGRSRGGYRGNQNNMSQGAVLAMFKKMFEEHVGSAPRNTITIEQEPDPVSTKETSP